MRVVDIIASGYEWVCPDCETFVREIGLTETVECPCCGAKFETAPSEHAYGS